MAEGLSRVQLGLLAAVGIALVLLGVRALRGEEEGANAGQGAPAVSLMRGERAKGSGLTVHVAGAVREPGVYRLPAGSRVSDAVAKAGGAGPGGDPNLINLAAPLADGQQVVVPARAGARSAAADAAGAGSEDGPISLGSADQADLEAIDGIGPVTAANIIEFRDQRGGISSIEELDEIPGIGPATLEALSQRLQP